MERKGAVLTWVVVIAIVLIVGVVLLNTGIVQLSPGGGLASYTTLCGQTIDSLRAGYETPNDETIRILSKCNENSDIGNYARVTAGADDGSCTENLDADFDRSGSIGQSDLLFLLEEWKADASDRADFNGDGVTDRVDMLALLEDWGPVSIC